MFDVIKKKLYKVNLYFIKCLMSTKNNNIKVKREFAFNVYNE